MLLFIMVASFAMAMGVSITLIWGAGVIKSMRIGVGNRTITILINIFAATIALIGIVLWYILPDYLQFGYIMQ